MNKETLAVAGLIIGLLIGVSIGYTAFRGTAPQGAPQTVTSTYTATKTKTETKTQTEEYSIKLSYNKNTGLYLVDKEGRTLYFFAKDTNGSSSCYGACAEKWPPFTPRQLVIPSTLNISDFSFVKRSDGTTQLAYKGQPLYYWVNDHYRGDTTGHGVKNVWFVASTEGTKG